MPAVVAVIPEGSILANQIRPNKNKNAEEVFFPVIRYKNNSTASQSRHFLCYIPSYHSISVAPTSWKTFLRSSENKTELFRFLQTEIYKSDHGEIIWTGNGVVIPMFLHVKDVTAKWFWLVMIITVDTVLVSAFLRRSWCDAAMHRLWVWQT